MITASVIRTMTRDDFPALEELYYDFHEHHARGVPIYLRHLGEPDVWDRTPLRAALEKILADDSARVFVAEVEECLAGLIEVHFRQDAPSPAIHSQRYLELQSLMVAAPFRRQRLAWQLVQHAATWAREIGATEIRLNVWEFNGAALRLYQQMGFRTLQRRMMIQLDEAGPGVSIQAALWERPLGQADPNSTQTGEEAPNDMPVERDALR